MALVFPLNISCLSGFSSRFHWWCEYSANQLRNERKGSRGADLRLLLTAHRGGEIRGERHHKWGKSWKQRCRWGESSWLFSWPFPHSSPPSCLFFFGGGGLWHNASANRGNSNTLLWPKYSSVARWLAKRRSRSDGGGGAGLVRHFHIPVSAEAPLKFKYLSELEIDPFLWLSLPLCCQSSYAIAPISFHHCLLTSPILPSISAEGEKKSKGGSNAQRDRQKT